MAPKDAADAAALRSRLLSCTFVALHLGCRVGQQVSHLMLQGKGQRARLGGPRLLHLLSLQLLLAHRG